MTYLFAGFGVLYVLTVLALRLLGYSAALPYSFVPFLVLICLPLTVTVICIAGLLPTRAGWPVPRGLVKVGCMIAGLALTYWLRQPAVWLVAAVALMAYTRHWWAPSRLARIGFAIVVMTAGYALIWNVNYLAAAAVGERQIDGLLLAMDTALLRALGLTGADGSLFPLTSSPTALRLLEHSYLMLFPQVLIGLILAVWQSARTGAKWLLMLFTAYGTGLLVFIVVPSVGPPIFAPQVIHPLLADTFTGELMRLMESEFRAVQEGGSLTGFGYFVALPSLHVAVAVMVQSTMRVAPFLFWTWLPVTILLIASTVVLGYHYVVDLPAGLVLGFALARLMPGPSLTRDVVPGQEATGIVFPGSCENGTGLARSEAERARESSGDPARVVHSNARWQRY